MNQQVTPGRVVLYRVSESEDVVAHVTAVHYHQDEDGKPTTQVLDVSLALLPEFGPVEFVQRKSEGTEPGSWHWPTRT